MNIKHTHYFQVNLYEHCGGQTNVNGNAVGCFGIFSNKAESADMDAKNQDNCFKNKNCVAAASFQHCYRKSNGDINAECQKFLPEFERYGKQGFIRVLLQAQLRYYYKHYAKY